jgi:hypothetical protein
MRSPHTHWHRAGVVDLQLLSVAVDRLAGDSVDFLPGFARCARRWLGNSTMRVVSALKKRIVELYEDDTADDALWGRRPLPVDVVRYAAADVALQAALQVRGHRSSITSIARRSMPR